MTLLIEKNDDIIFGKPALKGTRIGVELVFDLVRDGLSVDEIIEEYPHLERNVVEGVVEVGLIARHCLDAIDPDSMARKLLGKPLHLGYE
jgi:uncharacterized protein (DUF433 family)